MQNLRHTIPAKNVEKSQASEGVNGYISGDELPVVIQKNLVIRARVYKPKRKRKSVS